MKIEIDSVISHLDSRINSYTNAAKFFDGTISPTLQRTVIEYTAIANELQILKENFEKIKDKLSLGN